MFPAKNVDILLKKRTEVFDILAEYRIVAEYSLMYAANTRLQSTYPYK